MEGDGGGQSDSLANRKITEYTTCVMKVNLMLPLNTHIDVFHALYQNSKCKC